MEETEEKDQDVDEEFQAQLNEKIKKFFESKPFISSRDELDNFLSAIDLLDIFNSDEEKDPLWQSLLKNAENSKINCENAIQGVNDFLTQLEDSGQENKEQNPENDNNKETLLTRFTRISRLSNKGVSQGGNKNKLALNRYKQRAIDEYDVLDSNSLIQFKKIFTLLKMKKLNEKISLEDLKKMCEKCKFITFDINDIWRYLSFCVSEENIKSLEDKTELIINQDIFEEVQSFINQRIINEDIEYDSDDLEEDENKDKTENLDEITLEIIEKLIKKSININENNMIMNENNINNSNYHLIKFGIDENEKYRFGILPKKTYIKEINLPENNMQIKHIYAFGKRIIIQKSSNDNKEILYLGGMDFSGFELDGFELLDFNEQKFLNTKIKNLCLGTNHCIILDEENNLYGIGDNTYGELGGSKVNVNSFSLLDKELLSKIWFQNADKKKFSNKNEFQIKKIVCGARHTLILSNDGKIFCLGDNSENQCYGLETRIQKPIKLELGIEKEIVDVYSGYTHNLIIIKNGDKEEILTWGDASMGKLGYNEEHLSQSNPKEILALKEKCVNYVCLGFQMSVIVTGSSQNALFKK